MNVHALTRTGSPPVPRRAVSRLLTGTGAAVAGGPPLLPHPTGRVGGAAGLFGLGWSALAKAITNAFFSTLFGLEAALVRSLVSEVMSTAVPATTALSLAPGSWFASAAGTLAPVAEVLVAPLLFAATIGAVLRRDVHRLARAWGVALPASLLGAAALVQLCRVGLQVTDAMTGLIEASVYPGLGHLFARVVGLSFGGAAGFAGAQLVQVVFGLLLVAGGMALWLEMVLRSAAIELAVFFMPLALAGLVWPATAHWARRLVEVLVALLLAKPVVMAALCLGARALAGSQVGVESVVTGSAVLLMAAFAPFMLLRLVPVVEVTAIAHLQGAARQPFHAASRTAQRVASMAAAGMGGSSQMGGPPGGGGAAHSVATGPSAGAEQLLARVSGSEGPGPAGPRPGTSAGSGASLG